VRQALRALLKNKLIQKDKRGEFHCGQITFLHPEEKIHGSRKKRLRAHWEKMAKNGGKILFRYHHFSRIVKPDLVEYYPHLIRAVSGAGICSTDEGGDDSALILVEASVREIVPF